MTQEIDTRRNQNKCRELFEIISKIGETLAGGLHIIDITEGYNYPDYEGEQSFRIYHKTGYCFDIAKQADFDCDGNFYEWDYHLYSEWDGAKKITAEEAINLILNWTKN